ncbi:MAG: hypothetical protein KF699_03550 [Phycisphaeraceae bacterium]|nr:hypothetical protein [Phycisphaeraceae bacterium]
MMEGLGVIHTLVLTACTVGPATIAAALDPTDEQVRAWLASEAKRAARFDVPPSLVVQWTQEDYNTLTPDELTSLRAEVAGKPYHPKRVLLDNAERQIRDGKQSVHMFWLSDSRGRWRFGLEYPGQLVSDTVYDPSGQSWQRGNGTLKLFRARDVEAGGVVDQDPKAEELTFRPAIDRILFGSLGANSALGVRMQAVQVDGDRWVAEFFLPTEAGRAGEMTITGRWSEEHKRGFVEQLEYARPRVPGHRGDRVRFYGWTHSPDADIWVATDIQFFDGLNRMERRYTSVDVRALSATDVRIALDVPTSGAVDTFRGVVRLSRRLDYPAGRDERLDPDAGTIAESRTLRGHGTSPAPDRRRLLGWTVLGAISVIASLLICRRVGLRITGGTV